MKIKPEHYEYLKEKMRINAGKIKQYREYLKTDPRVKDVEKRIRWYLLYASVGSKWICENVYQYAHNTHIDTALRNIMKEIEE